MLCSCNIKNNNQTADSDSSQQNKLDQFKWIIGSWQNISSDGELYEIWTKTNDSLYSGYGFMLLNNDTVFSEKISLQLKGNDLLYIPTVKNQNNGEPVSFKLVSDINGEFVFENKEHDFPQRIIYSNPNPDSLYARVEGDQQGKFHKEEFPMSRKK